MVMLNGHFVSVLTALTNYSQVEGALSGIRKSTTHGVTTRTVSFSTLSSSRNALLDSVSPTRKRQNSSRRRWTSERGMPAN